MRRISLALALVGAVATVGCGGSTPSQAGSGNKGVAGSAFTVSIRGDSTAGTAIWDPLSQSTLYVPQGGVVTGPGGINCGDLNKICSANFAYGTPVTLTFTPDSGYYAVAGDCSGSGASGTCPLSGDSDKQVIVAFSTTAIAHPNFSDPAIHGPQYFAFQAGTTGALTCTQCHGPTLQGLGLAPSCNACHNLTLIPAPNLGHFDATQQAWNENGTTCYRCHTTLGFQNWIGFKGSMPTGDTVFAYEGNPAGTYVNTFTANGVTPVAGPLSCDACHNAVSDPVTAGITDILFPSGVKMSGLNNIVALCGQCHMGRQAGSGPAGGPNIDNTIGTVQPGTFSLKFVNPHYFGAAAVMFGANVNGMYQYTGKTYATYPSFFNKATNGGAPGPYNSPHGAVCTQCHPAANGDHFTAVNLATTLVVPPSPTYKWTEFPVTFPTPCATCHSGGYSLAPVQANIGALAAQLLVDINAYQVAGGQSPLCYNANGGGTYFFIATANPGGVCGATETTAYPTKFDPKSLKAAFNLQWSQKEPGAFAHNGPYMEEALYDSIQDLNSANVIPCDAAASTCQAAQLLEGVLTPAGTGSTGAAITRP